MSISTNKGDVTVIELHKEPKNHAVEMKTYILDDLKALKKKFNMINHNPPIDVNGEASNGASINIDMKTSLFELMKEGFIDHLKKETDIQKLEFPVTSKAQSKNGDEADVEYHVDITFVVQGITEKVKMKCFTTNCRIQVQNFGKHTRKEHLGNEFSPKYFVNTFVVPYLESVKEKALEFDKIFVPHLRAEIQRLQKRKIQDRVRKSSALDIDPKNTKCVNNNCQWVNVILKNVEAYGICSACQGYEHHHCAGTSKMMKEEIKSGQVNFFCTNCMEKNPALGKDMLVSNCKMIVQVPGTPKPHNDNENQVQSLTYCPGEVVDDPAELYAGAGTGAVKRTGTEINQATSAGSEIKDGKIIKCKHCEYSCKIESELILHETEKHPVQICPKLSCKNCDKEFEEEMELQIHVQSHMVSRFQCDQCDYKSDDRDLLETHIKFTHELPLPYKCSKCDISFNIKSDLDEHMKLHTEVFETHTCNLCAFKASSEADLDNHKREKHIGSPGDSTEEHENETENSNESLETVTKKLKLMEESYDRLMATK